MFDLQQKLLFIMAGTVVRLVISSLIVIQNGKISIIVIIMISCFGFIVFGELIYK